MKKNFLFILNVFIVIFLLVAGCNSGVNDASKNNVFVENKNIRLYSVKIKSNPPEDSITAATGSCASPPSSQPLPSAYCIKPSNKVDKLSFCLGCVNNQGGTLSNPTLEVTVNGTPLQRISDPISSFDCNTGLPNTYACSPLNGSENVAVKFTANTTTSSPIDTTFRIPFCSSN